MNADGAKPIFDDPSASFEMRQLVELARKDGPTHEQLEQLASRVGSALGVSVVPTPRTGRPLGSPPERLPTPIESATAALRTALFGKLLASTSAKLLAALALATSLGLGVWSHSRSTLAPSAVPQPESAPRQQASTAAQGGAETATAALLPLAPAASVDRGAAQRSPADESVSAAPKSSAGRGASARTRPARRGADVGSPTSSPSSPLGSRRAGQVATQPSELSLIERAQAARFDAASALRLLNDHERLYPAGSLAQEREMILIELLLRTGEVEQGRARAERFAREHADSAHLPHLRGLLARSASE